MPYVGQYVDSLQAINDCLISLLTVPYVGQYVGSLQAVKESLRRMRWRRDRMTNMSMSVSSSSSQDDNLRNFPSLSSQHHNRALKKIASELVEFVWNKPGGNSLVIDLMGRSDCHDLGSSTDCKTLLVALQHQQTRAEVGTLHIIL